MPERLRASYEAQESMAMRARPSHHVSSEAEESLASSEAGSGCRRSVPPAGFFPTVARARDGGHGDDRDIRPDSYVRRHEHEPLGGSGASWWPRSLPAAAAIHDNERSAAVAWSLELLAARGRLLKAVALLETSFAQNFELQGRNRKQTKKKSRRALCQRQRPGSSQLRTRVHYAGGHPRHIPRDADDFALGKPPGLGATRRRHVAHVCRGHYPQLPRQRTDGNVLIFLPTAVNMPSAKRSMPIALGLPTVREVLPTKLLPRGLCRWHSYLPRAAVGLVICRGLLFIC